MRTRFLNIDYFAPAAEIFQLLPVPDLEAFPQLTLKIEDELLRADSLPEISKEIERLPIDDALSFFLSQVVPRCANLEFPSVASIDGTEPQPETESLPSSPSFTLFDPSSPLEDQYQTIGNGDDRHQLKLPLFELHDSLENECFQEDTIDRFLNKAQIKENTESWKPDDNLLLPEDLQEGYLHFMERDVDIGKVADEKDDRDENIDEETQDKPPSTYSTIPILEVDDINLKSIDPITCEGLLLSFLKGISLPLSEPNLLELPKHDFLNVLSADWSSNPYTEEEITTVGDPSSSKKSSISLLGDGIPSIDTFTFEEFESFETNPSQRYLEFLTAESERCLTASTWLEEDFCSFNTLIVSRELALTDEVFKSLPVPIISDEKKMIPFGSIMRNTMTSIRPMNFPAIDQIYLDWHLLDKEHFSSTKSVLQLLSHEFLIKTEDFEFEIPDTKLKAIDYILSDDTTAPIKMETHEEFPKMFSNIISKSLKSSLPKSTPIHHKTQSLLLNPISVSNDLQYFLDPSKAEDAHIYPAKDEPKSTQEKMTSSASSDDAASLHSTMPSYSKHQEAEIETEHSLSETVIIVNTRNCDKDLIISRRITYQKILALEKKGARIIERDVDLPLDIVLSCNVCLLLYDRKTMKTKQTLDDTLPLDNIATNVLTSLSFSFSRCILVFEGDYAFITSVMDGSDSLYAAATSLGVDLQLFCSYSPAVTDEIVLSSILQYSARDQRIYSRSTESETLAESFLTKFPSINPMTAIAMLTGDFPLHKFISRDTWRFSDQNIDVPQECADLFGAVCRFGERDDSKSITTDCSSSVSSGHVSDNDRKRGRYSAENEDQWVTQNAGLKKLHVFDDDKLLDDVAFETGPMKRKAKEPMWDLHEIDEYLKEVETPARQEKCAEFTYPQKGSPWTLEFLKRVREKSRLHKQQSVPLSNRSGNIDKVMKMKSPSIIEMFKFNYHGSSSSLKPAKEQTRNIQRKKVTKNSKYNSEVGSLSSTPMDKRAKQSLSFTRNGPGSQTKLVWNSDVDHHLSRKFR